MMTPPKPTARNYFLFRKDKEPNKRAVLLNIHNDGIDTIVNGVGLCCALSKFIAATLLVNINPQSTRIFIFERCFVLHANTIDNHINRTLANWRVSHVACQRRQHLSSHLRKILQLLLVG
eukprot:GEMP01057881.1.p2 GENE.GEMP01057881.1~~GEMP01057881.1.p2  ORF type:complete len:120 (-),score=12.40 GEMP01057881.1:414-773(-)